MVLNHSSNEHPWFQQSRTSRSNPKSDWYVWRDAKTDGSPPNNWLSIFGGSAWQWDEAREQFFLHTFLVEQPDLNWRNPSVQAAMLDVLRFWLDRGVDGFRLDAPLYIMKDPLLRDNPPNPSGEMTTYKPMGEYDSQIHDFDKGNADIHDVFREMRRVLDSYNGEHPRMAVGEIHVFDWREWASYYGTKGDELHMPFNFGFLKAPWEATAIRRVVDGSEAALPTGAWPNFVLGNHDEHRIASRVGRDQARVGMMLLLTLRGTPTAYYGDELDMEDVPIPESQRQDGWGSQVGGDTRDGERTPMQWSAAPNGGFSPANVRPWLPLAPDFQTFNVDRELDEPGSMLNLTLALLQLRHSSPVLQRGSYTPVEEGLPACFVYTRQLDGETFLIALNFTREQQTVPLGSRGSILLSTHLDRSGEEDLRQLRLRPSEGVVIAL